VACDGVRGRAVACDGVRWRAVACGGVRWRAMACSGVRWRAVACGVIVCGVTQHALAGAAITRNRSSSSRIHLDPTQRHGQTHESSVWRGMSRYTNDNTKTKSAESYMCHAPLHPPHTTARIPATALTHRVDASSMTNP